MLSLLAPLTLSLVLGPMRMAHHEEKWLGAFQPYPGARRLCDQHVSASTMHISWTAYATTDDLDAVAAFYAKHEGGPPKREANAMSLEGPKDATLSAHVNGTAYPTCGVNPTPAEKTVIIVSQAIRGTAR